MLISPERLKAMRKIHRSVERRLPLVVKGLQERLRSRVDALAGGEQETWLNKELALVADRCDVTEELIRFRSPWRTI